MIAADHRAIRARVQGDPGATEGGATRTIKCAAPGCGVYLDEPVLYLVNGHPWCLACFRHAFAYVNVGR